jgi:hypothetical protein
MTANGATSSAHLTLLSPTLPAARMAELAGLEPDSLRERDEDDPIASRRRASLVSWRSQLPGSASPGEHVASVLARLAPVRERIHSLAAADEVSSARVGVYHASADPNPGLLFDAELVAGVAALGAELWLDLYVWPAGEAGA